VRRIFIVAGELSGDVNAAHLVRKMKEVGGEFEVVGVGGERMRRAGVEIMWDSTDWGSIGVFDALVKARKLLPLWKGIFNHLRRVRYDLLLLVDYRYFNMKLAKEFHGKCPIYYYFSPVDWRLNNAPLFWKFFGLKREGGGKRYRELKKSVDLCFLTFPFAIQKYEEFGVPYVYIGHPGCERIKERWRELPFAEEVVGVFPGSREGELLRHLPVLLPACRKLQDEGERVVFSLAYEVYRGIFERFGVEREFEVWKGDSIDLMARSKLLLLCSGTATHEATFLEKPMVVFYRVNSLLARFSQFFVLNLPFWTFPNIMAGKRVVPELIQWDFTAPKLYSTVRELLSSPRTLARQVKSLREVKSSLCVEGGVERAAKEILKGAGVLR